MLSSGLSFDLAPLGICVKFRPTLFTIRQTFPSDKVAKILHIANLFVPAANDRDAMFSH